MNPSRLQSNEDRLGGAFEVLYCVGTLHPDRMRWEECHDPLFWTMKGPTNLEHSSNVRIWLTGIERLQAGEADHGSLVQNLEVQVIGGSEVRPQVGEHG